MHESKVMKVAFVSSLVGIMLLFYLSQSQEVPERPAVLQEEDIGKTFLMRGLVKGVTDKNGTTVIMLELYENTAVMFDGDETIPSIGDAIKFYGKAENYGGKTLIRGENIEITSNSSGKG